MVHFTFESTVENKDELRKEIQDLLWKIDHTWPVMVCSGGNSEHTKWITSKIDEAWIKVRRQKIEFKKGL